MIFAYLCVNCGSLWVSSVAQYEVMNRHVYVHNNNVVRINLQMLLVKDCSRELIPTLNLPQKSFETETKPRRPLKRHETDEGSPAASTSKESSRVYKHLND